MSQQPLELDPWEDLPTAPAADDCGHPNCISQRQITACLAAPSVVDVPLALVVFVAGQPAPQGSKRGFVNKHTGRVSMVESSKAVKPWREDVRQALMVDGQPRATFDGAVLVGLTFVLPRPKSTPKRRTPPAVKKPDVDKLTRSTMDAIGSAGVYRDDSQVIHLVAYKRIAELDETPGCHITIRDA